MTVDRHKSTLALVNQMVWIYMAFITIVIAPSHPLMNVIPPSPSSEDEQHCHLNFKCRNWARDRLRL